MHRPSRSEPCTAVTTATDEGDSVAASITGALAATLVIEAQAILANETNPLRSDRAGALQSINEVPAQDDTSALIEQAQRENRKAVCPALWCRANRSLDVCVLFGTRPPHSALSTNASVLSVVCRRWLRAAAPGQLTPAYHHHTTPGVQRACSAQKRVGWPLLCLPSM